MIRPLLVLLVVLYPTVWSDLNAAGRTSLATIARFPHQDTTASVREALPIALSDSTLIVVWAESTAVRYSKSTNSGGSWSPPTQILTPLLTVSNLVGLRTNSGRLIIAYNDSLRVRCTISDNDGLTWLPAVVLVQTSGSFLQISETSDSKIWLAWRSALGGGTMGRYVTSTDNGTTWSVIQQLPSGLARNDISFISGQSAALHCIYSTATLLPRIERMTSTNGGVTWSTAVSILSSAVPQQRPRIAKQPNGTVWLLYENTRSDSLPVPYQSKDVNYIVSADSGISWSPPTAFTRFVGNDFMHNVSMLNDAPFVMFASNRWGNSDRMWYGIIGETPDDNPPPIFFSGSQLHSFINLENWVRATVDDEAGISAVNANYFVDSIGLSPVQMFDDGLHWDGQPGDNVWGGSLDSLPLGPTECRFAISDVGGNTLSNVYGFSPGGSFPPSVTHVTQGSSMYIAFNRKATFGKHVLPSETYPGYGLRYPNNLPFEHVYGAGLWVGGKIDTSAGGTGTRIKAVSTGYEGNTQPLNEFLPRTDADSIWKVYGRNAPKPSGWDQYWGSALQFRTYGDENFFNQYDDYTHPASLRPMKLNIIQSSFTWNDVEGAGIQIVEFRIMNNSERIIDSAYVAFFMDADVGPIEQPDYRLRNSSGFLPTPRIAYTYNPIDFGSTPVGVSVLNTDRSLDSLRFSFQWYSAPQSPNSDALKFDLMSSGAIKPDEFPFMSDTRFLVSFGPFTIQPYTSPNPDTLRVAFALLAGMDINQLQLHASRAHNIYQTIISGVEQINPSIPTEFALEQNYPNPFNPSTNIEFRIPSTSFVTLEVFDILGRRVATLINESKKPGVYKANFNASGLASGVYMYQLKSGGYLNTRKALLLR